MLAIEYRKRLLTVANRIIMAHVKFEVNTTLIKMVC